MAADKELVSSLDTQKTNKHLWTICSNCTIVLQRGTAVHVLLQRAEFPQ
jgi:hypothetical protein